MVYQLHSDPRQVQGFIQHCLDSCAPYSTAAAAIVGGEVDSEESLGRQRLRNHDVVVKTDADTQKKYKDDCHGEQLSQGLKLSSIRVLIAVSHPAKVARSQWQSLFSEMRV